MGSVWRETVNGFRAFVQDLKKNGPKDGVNYLFSLTTFDTRVETPIVAQPIADVDEEILAHHGPRGATALYDAVGMTLAAIDKERHGAEKIICVITTDGQENSSREVTKDALQKNIEAHLAAGDWSFVYMGTQPETWDDATSIGIAVGATAGYSGAHAQAAYETISGGIHRFAMSSEPQVRNLFASKYTSADAMSNAKMTVRQDKDTDATTATVTVAPPSIPGKGNRKRWR
jgi:hypothetical protein